MLLYCPRIVTFDTTKCIQLAGLITSFKTCQSFAPFEIMWS